jgi:hypothetical protein
MTEENHATRIPCGGQSQSERAALAAVLERKGLLTKAEGLAEVKQLRGTSVKARQTHHERRGDPGARGMVRSGGFPSA